MSRDFEKEKLKNIRRLEKKAQVILGRRPSAPSQWAKLADDLVKWAKEGNSLNIDEFAIQRNIGPHRFKKWKDKDSYFAEAYELAVHILGNRRFYESRDKKKDSTLLVKEHPLYNWAYAEYLQSLKDKDEAIAKAGKATIYITDPTSVPNTGLVPDLPEEKS